MQFGHLWIIGVLSLGLLSSTAQATDPMPMAVAPIARLKAADTAKLLARAQMGFADGETKLGEVYLYGNGLPQDYEKAAAWLRKAADRGYGQAQNDLGNMYYVGAGVPQDYAVSASWFQKSADQGFGNAQDVLGRLYAQGIGVPKDNIQAYKWFDLETRAQFARLGGDYPIKERENAAALLTPSQLAEAKDQSARWHPLPRTPDQQVADAYAVIAAHNYVEALNILSPLAADGHPLAEILLGDMYSSGLGVPKNDSAALAFYQKAANQGNPEAQYSVGMMYAVGEGVKEDQTISVSWLRKAADQGFAEAQRRLGLAIAVGKGATLDYAEAASWFRKAAEQGDGDAQYYLGLLNAGNSGLPQDYEQAYKWIGLACIYSQDAAKRNDAAKLLARLSQQATADQIAAAKDEIAEWQPAYQIP